jgi:hypothetical protein
MLMNPKNETVLIETCSQKSSVSRSMVYERCRELALKDGRAPGCVSQTDYEQAKWELTGERDIDRQEAILGAIEDVDRRSPLPSVISRKMAECAGGNDGKFKAIGS